MNEINHAFFEEFKHLDKLCEELYGDVHGVTHYIEDMKAVSAGKYRSIPNWESDLKRLVQFRHIRNRMAHEYGAFDKEKCTQDDINWIRNFYERIMQQSDPIALLHKNSQVQNHTSDKNYAASNYSGMQIEINTSDTTKNQEKISNLTSNKADEQPYNQTQQIFEDDEILDLKDKIIIAVIIFATLVICSMIVMWGLSYR